MKSLVKFLLCSGVLMLRTSVALAAQQHAVFIAYHSEDQQAYQQWYTQASTLLDKHHCHALRHGALQAQQGNVSWQSLNQFTLLLCDQAVLANLVADNDPQTLLSGLDHALIIEGEAHVLKENNAPPPTGAEYIVKVSYFNQLSPQRRDQDLLNLNSEKSTLNNAWYNDIVMRPSAAVGVIRPDELTFLYYPKPGQGKQFRDNNPAILNKIKDFNQQHVSRFTYLLGSLP